MADGNDTPVEQGNEVPGIGNEVSPFVREREACHKDPMILLHLGLLKIKNKHRQLAPFELNDVQKKVLAKIKEVRQKQKPVRICILKGRQFGISTLSEAIIYAF